MIEALGGEDTLIGGNSDDELSGGGDFDMLFGGNGNDVLEDGAESDVLFDGYGNDVFVYRQLFDDRDRLRDFQIGTDLIDLPAIFADSRCDSDTPFEDYVRLGSDSFSGGVLVEVLDIGQTRETGSDGFKAVALVSTFQRDLDASSFIV